MQENYKVYVITNKSNGKQYVGQTKHTLKRRMQWHIRDAKNGQKRILSQAIREYGVDNFKIQVIEEHLSPNYVDECERYWIMKPFSKCRRCYFRKIIKIYLQRQSYFMV